MAFGAAFVVGPPTHHDSSKDLCIAEMVFVLHGLEWSVGFTHQTQGFHLWKHGDFTTGNQDQFFQKASEFARVRGLPRIYVSCNSGARVGLVEELKPLFKARGED